jgi:FkbM family methyltransferase
MKLRNIFELLGVRGKARYYDYRVREFPLRDNTVIHYAGWNHPREEPKQFNDQLIDGYRKYIRPGDFCIDIGAHTGDTTIPMALAAGVTGCVLALEPNPFVYHVLEKNIRANRETTNIKSIMAAAAPAEGFMTMEYSDSGFCNGGRHQGIAPLQHGHAYKLEVFSLELDKELRDDFAGELPQLRFIKVDAEGFDFTVLKSLEALIKVYQPYIQTEIFKSASSSYRQDLFSWLFALEYRIFEVVSTDLQVSRALHTWEQFAKRHGDILAVPHKEIFD